MLHKIVHWSFEMIKKLSQFLTISFLLAFSPSVKLALWMRQWLHLQETAPRGTSIFLHWDKPPDCHFRIVFFVTGTNLCCPFSFYLIYSRLIPKNCGVENNLWIRWNAMLFNHLNIVHMSLASNIMAVTAEGVVVADSWPSLWGLSRGQ